MKYARTLDLLGLDDNIARRVRMLEITAREAETGGGRFTHTFVIGGEITAGMYIPPWINLEPPADDVPDTTTPNVTLGEIRSEVRTGTVTLHFEYAVNGSGTWTATTTGYGLAWRGRLRPVITAASGAADLSVAFLITPGPGGIEL